MLGRHMHRPWCDEINRLKQLFEKHDGFWSAVTKRTVFIIHTITQQSDVCFSNQQPVLQHLDIQPLRNSDEKVRRQTSCSPASYTNQPIRTSHADQPIGRDLQPAKQSAAFYERWRIQHSPPATGFPAKHAIDQPTTSSRPHDPLGTCSPEPVSTSLFAKQQEVVEFS